MVANLTKLITEMAKSRYYDSPQNSLYQEDFYFYFLFYLFIYFFFLVESGKGVRLMTLCHEVMSRTQQPPSPHPTEFALLNDKIAQDVDYT